MYLHIFDLISPKNFEFVYLYLKLFLELTKGENSFAIYEFYEAYDLKQCMFSKPNQKKELGSISSGRSRSLELGFGPHLLLSAYC